MEPGRADSKGKTQDQKGYDLRTTPGRLRTRGCFNV